MKTTTPRSTGQRTHTEFLRSTTTRGQQTSRQWLGVVAACGAQLLASPGFGASVPVPGTTAGNGAFSSTSSPRLDRQVLETFFDGLVPYALAKNDIAGALVAVVHDDTVLFEKGYGYADVVARKPMLPNSTLIRPGSITKLFTFTAVMQLVEQHRLDLDRDVNAYLDFKIPATFPQPITLRSLLTHTAGFEESIKDVFVLHASQLRPLSDYLRNNLPRRVKQPGAVVAYSNYGAALAGYIVERVAGEPYVDYVREHILVPLKMTRTTLQQPLSASLEGDMAKGYLTASSRTPGDFELIGAAPAGAMSTTVAELAHFAIAHLNDGVFEDARILAPETARLMHATAYQPAEKLNGYALGFYEESRNGLRIIGHGGDTALFHSDLHLIPEDKIAVIFAFNSDGVEGKVEQVRTYVFRAFLDRYFPFKAPRPPTSATARADAARVVGPYRLSRVNQSSFFRLTNLLQGETVTADPNGDIHFSFFKDESGTPKSWREIGPLLYQEEDGQAHLKFVTEPSGRVRYFISDDFIPVFVYELASSKSGFLLPVLIASAVIFATSAILWPVLALVRRWAGRKLELSPLPRRLRLTTRLAAILAFGVLMGWAILITTATETVGALSDVLDPYLTVLYLLDCLAFALCLAAVGNAIVAWLSAGRNLLARAGESVLAAAAAYFCWFVVAFHLASFNYHY